VAITRAPWWWYGGEGSLVPALLEPAALLWRGATWLRWKMSTPHGAELPVLCVGNPTAGGAGKTPLVIELARLLAQRGERPVFLTRGYGGAARGPLLADRKVHTARDIGDEALLLARHAPTVVARDRRAGARQCSMLDASVILMDDGFQNPTLHKDFSLLVVDCRLGAGNGLVIPAGPLRAPLARQLAAADALILVGQGTAGEAIAARMQRLGKPVLTGRIEPAGETGWLAARPVHAYAGIAHPEKFFETLRQAGARLAGTTSFPDHHVFTQNDAAQLLAAAQRDGAQLVTTEKDFVRLEGAGSALADLRRATRALPVRLTVNEEEMLLSLLEDALQKRRAERRG